MREKWWKKISKKVMAGVMSTVMAVTILPTQQWVYAEVDPSMASATAVTYGGKVNGVLKGEGDSKYYAFTTGALPAYYKISAKSNTADAQFEVSIRDAENQEVTSMIFDTEEAVLLVPEIEKNTRYYLCVSVIIADANAGYSIQLDQLLDDHENTIELAKEISVGNTMAGKFETTTDVDVLKFTTGEQNAFYEIVYSNIDSQQDIELKVLDGEGMMVDSLIVNSNSQSALTLKLEPNNVYYLQMQPTWEGGSYSVQVKSCVDEGGEDFEHAQAVNFNQIIAGGLQSATDFDYYVITAAKDVAEYQLVVGADRTNGQQIVVDVYDYNQTCMQELSNLVDPGNTVTKDITLEPGQVYYVAISGMQVGDTYTLKFINPKEETGSSVVSPGGITVPVVTPAPQVAEDPQGGSNTQTNIQTNIQNSVTGAGITATEKNKVTLKSVKLNKSALTIKVGKKRTLKVVVLPKSIGVKKATWSVTKKKVASVSKKGVVTGVKKGMLTSRNFRPKNPALQIIIRDYL